MQRVLIIDGNYFAQRVLGQVNMGDSENNLNTELEQKNFKIALKNSLVNLYKSFNNENQQLIDQIIFVSDCGSWRKDIIPYRPYYIDKDSTQVIGYKEQRKAVKEESPINYDNFYRLYNEFIEDIRSTIIVFKINGLEGDDEIMLLANKFKQESSVLSVVFATDGDLDQIVKNNVIIFRNIRSKNAPNGEFVIPLSLYGKLFEKDMVNALLSNQLEDKYYDDLFGIHIGCIDGSNHIKRTLNTGISIATPYRTALVKSIAGDKKDNIFSLISWKASTGTRQYCVTEKIISKALEQHGYSLTEENCQKVLTSKENLFNLLLSLREVTKQKDVVIEEIAQHLKHNLKINVLSVKNVPTNLVDEFNKCWEANYDEIMHGKLNESDVMKFYSEINHNPKNRGKDVLADSIPDIVEEL